MMKFLPALLIAGISLTACNKKDASPTIDFGPNGGITFRDENGTPRGALDPTDWTRDGAWNQQELALFKPTGAGTGAELNGPGESFDQEVSLYPNPVKTEANLLVRQYGNSPIFSYVVVDRKYNVVQKIVINARANSSGNSYRFDFSALNKGETYRIYYVFQQGNTFGSKGHGDFKMAE